VLIDHCAGAARSARGSEFVVLELSELRFGVAEASGRHCRLHPHHRVRRDRIVNVHLGEGVQHSMVLDGRFGEAVGETVWRGAGTGEDAEQCDSNAVADLESLLQWRE